MTRRLLQLDCLFQKLKSRYGAEDEAVQALGMEIRTLEQARRQPTPRLPAHHGAATPTASQPTAPASLN